MEDKKNNLEKIITGALVVGGIVALAVTLTKKKQSPQPLFPPMLPCQGLSCGQRVRVNNFENYDYLSKTNLDQPSVWALELENTTECPVTFNMKSVDAGNQEGTHFFLPLESGTIIETFEPHQRKIVHFPTLTRVLDGIAYINLMVTDENNFNVCKVVYGRDG